MSPVNRLGAALLALLAACNRSSSSEYEVEASAPEDDALADDEPGDGEPGDGDGDGCPPDELRCDDSCVDPMTDPDNCGECGRTCFANPETLEGGCYQGECKPTYSECATQADGHATCEGVCAAFGEVCHDNDDDLGCVGGIAWGWQEEDDLDACVAQTGGGLLAFVENCEYELPFEQFHYVKCCCSQTAQPP